MLVFNVRPEIVFLKAVRFCCLERYTNITYSGKVKYVPLFTHQYDITVEQKNS